MEKLVEDGLVKSIGISNFSIKKVENLLASSPKILPATNQVELHPYLPQNRLLEFCKSKGLEHIFLRILYYLLYRQRN